MATKPLPPGIYHIVVASIGRFQHERLTDGPHVTVSPPSAHPDPKQEWQLRDGKDGNVIIERPSGTHPSLSLTYKGEAGNPKPGDKIELRHDESPTEWRLVTASGYNAYIRVANSHLGIGIAPEDIDPPLLDLKVDGQLEWLFDSYFE